MKNALKDLITAWKEYLRRFFYAKSFHGQRATVRRKLLISLMTVFFGFTIIIWITKGIAYGQEDLVFGAANYTPALFRFLPLTLGSSLAAMFLHFARRKFAIFKRFFDMFIATLGLVLFSPLLLILGIFIRLDSSGPILFKQTRLGKGGSRFKMWKLRTMRDNAEIETGPVWTSEDDPRVTGLGRFIRKSHLDELPQLINVLKGDMSLIGPRPERPEFIDTIKEDIPNFDNRLDIKPGVTGLAQVRYRYGASIADAGKKLKYDEFYIKKKSWSLDFKILYWTFGKVLADEGAR